MQVCIIANSTRSVTNEVDVQVSNRDSHTLTFKILWAWRPSWETRKGHWRLCHNDVTLSWLCDILVTLTEGFRKKGHIKIFKSGHQICLTQYQWHLYVRNIWSLAFFMPTFFYLPRLLIFFPPNFFTWFTLKLIWGEKERERETKRDKERKREKML